MKAAVFEMMRYKSIMGQKEKIPALSHLICTPVTHAEGLRINYLNIKESQSLSSQ